MTDARFCIQKGVAQLYRKGNDMKLDRKELLKNTSVLAEIDRHKWLASERAGRDIGFERAADEWFVKEAEGWAKMHLPKQNTDVGGKKKKR
ncbi:MAG: hypothetical protein V2A70_09410 [Candidatus Omnitrophota bacterium]